MPFLATHVVRLAPNPLQQGNHVCDDEINKISNMPIVNVEEAEEGRMTPFERDGRREDAQCLGRRDDADKKSQEGQEHSFDEKGDEIETIQDLHLRWWL